MVQTDVHDRVMEHELDKSQAEALAVDGEELTRKVVLPE